jgi:hypothetical protein
MAQYIKYENQTILWNTIQKVGLFSQLLNKQQQSLWFREIVGIFYEECRDKRLSRVDLENLNKSTIQYMIMSTAQPSKTCIISTRPNRP